MKLNTLKRQAILSALVSFQFGEQEKDLIKLSAQFSLSVYRRLYTQEERQEMAITGTRFFPCSRSFLVSIEVKGQPPIIERLVLPTVGVFFFAYRDFIERGPIYKIEKDSDLETAYYKLKNTENLFFAAMRVKRRLLSRIIDDCFTYDQVVYQLPQVCMIDGLTESITPINGETP